MTLIQPIYAQIINPVLTNKDNINVSENPTGYINSAIQTIISVLFVFGVIYFVYHFILAGYHMISSMGDPKKYEEAQHALLYSLVGIVIIFSVLALLKLVGYIFGIDGLGTLEIKWPTI
ncbi:MAG: hypothetical protein PHE32_00625 [Candidatus Shapirobacteria bacterium]|nr:hypothetical protein [Candidatus Shapirobacteria bacterium]MDD4410201.1 hypothetical protein [Candidatus Shapirobacteria bacterium]